MNIVRIITEYWEKFFVMINNLETDIINASIQACATLLAVAVGYFFSSLSEKRQWKRVKTEHIREHQLSALLSLSYQLERIIVLFEEVIEKHNLFYENNSLVSNMQSIYELKMDTCKKEIKKMLFPVSDMECEVNKKILELRLLNYKKENIMIASSCVKNVENVLQHILNNLFLCKLDNSILSDLKVSLNSLIEEAEDGLRQ